jgi:SPP1 gp7 family putative phage head morphogenesis protein
MTSTIFSIPHLAAYTTLKPKLRPLRALRPLRIPRPIESWYRKELMAITDRVTSATEREIIPLLKAGYVESASDSAARATDAPPPGDYTNKTAVHEAVKRLETQHDVPDAAASNLAASAATQVSNSVDEKIAKEAVRSVAINIRPLLYQTTELGKLMRTNVDTNVNLIKSIPTKHFQRLEKMLNAGLSSGLRPEAMAKQIQVLTGISKRRAKFIARDQTAKMLSQFNGNRQQELGIKQYIWQTADDERVRPEHAALNGKLCSWNKPPLHGLNPGEDYNCRCIATPVFNVGGATVGAKQVAAIRPEVKPSMVTASWVNGIIGASIAKSQLSQAFEAVGKTDMSSAYSANEEGLDKLFKKGSGKYADDMDKMLSMSIADFGDETPPPTWFGSKYTNDSAPFNAYYWENGKTIGGKDFDASRTLEAIKGLNWLFDRHLTSVPMKTFRGMALPTQDVDKIKRRLEEFGIYEISNGGYGSTSRSKDVALEYASKNLSDEKPSKVLFELMIPSGYHALSLGKITTVKSDLEFLLLHSFNYHVFDIRYENNLIVLEATVKPIDKSKPVKDALSQTSVKTSQTPVKVYKKQKHLTYEEIIKLPRVSMGNGEYMVLP